MGEIIQVWNVPPLRCVTFGKALKSLSHSTYSSKLRGISSAAIYQGRSSLDFPMPDTTKCLLQEKNNSKVDKYRIANRVLEGIHLREGSYSLSPISSIVSPLCTPACL